MKSKHTFLTIIIVLIFNNLWAQHLEIKWYGTTCILISDGNTNLLFDPFFTRPTLLQIVTGNYKSDESAITNWLDKKELTKIKAVFTSHTHYDHAFDLGKVTQLSGAKVFGSSSTLNILKGTGQPPYDFTQIKPNDRIKIGDFEIVAMPGIHPSHLFNLTLLDGKIKQPISSQPSIFDYKLGEQFNFIIYHPVGNIMFHPSALPVKFQYTKLHKKIDTLLIGIAKRKSTEDLLQNIILPLEVNTIVPLHFDYFFQPLNKKLKHFPFINLNEFTDTINHRLEEVKVIVPKYGHIIE